MFISCFWWTMHPIWYCCNIIRFILLVDLLTPLRNTQFKLVLLFPQRGWRLRYRNKWSFLCDCRSLGSYNLFKFAITIRSYLILSNITRNNGIIWFNLLLWPRSFFQDWVKEGWVNRAIVNIELIFSITMLFLIVNGLTLIVKYGPSSLEWYKIISSVRLALARTPASATQSLQRFISWLFIFIILISGLSYFLRFQKADPVLFLVWPPAIMQPIYWLPLTLKLLLISHLFLLFLKLFMQLVQHLLPWGQRSQFNGSFRVLQLRFFGRWGQNNCLEVVKGVYRVFHFWQVLLVHYLLLQNGPDSLKLILVATLALL